MKETSYSTHMLRTFFLENMAVVGNKENVMREKRGATGANIIRSCG